MYLQVLHGGDPKRKPKEEIIKISKVKYVEDLSVGCKAGETLGRCLLVSTIDQPALYSEIIFQMEDGDVYRVLSEIGAILKEYKK